MHLMVILFYYTWSLLPLSKLSPDVVVETTPLPEVVLVSEYTVHTMAPNRWLVHACKIDNTLTRT